MNVTLNPAATPALPFPEPTFVAGGLASKRMEMSDEFVSETSVVGGRVVASFVVGVFGAVVGLLAGR